MSSPLLKYRKRKWKLSQKKRHTIIVEDDGIFLSSSLSYFQKINPLVLGFVIRSSKTSGLNFQEYSNYLLYVGVVTNKCLIFV